MAGAGGPAERSTATQPGDFHPESSPQPGQGDGCGGGPATWRERCERVTQHPSYLVSLIGIFFVILAGYFLAWPITMTDTDLWYHLSGGRYFWQNGAIPRDAFFSYVDHPTSWYNYYWLFQVVVYTLFRLGDYYALIVLRCLLYALTAFLICRFFVRRTENLTQLLLGLFAFVSCTLVIMGRELLVRPHLFSYLFIVVFLFVLERRRDKTWLLPLLGVLWANLHGIEFPVMFLIVLAYLAENYWRQLRRAAPGETMDKTTRWLVIAVLYTIFVTPGVTELVQLPFQTSFEKSAYQHLYIGELLSAPLRSFLVFAPTTVNGFVVSLQNAIVLLAAVSFLALLWQRKLRVSHAILFAGAVMLLGKHRRFVYEFTLLSIPLLHGGLGLVAPRDRLSRRSVGLAMALVLVPLPLLVFHSRLGNRPAYPFSQSNLPAGVVRFLNRNAAGGRILNEPNTGGYLPWALNGSYRIYMDLQMSLFSDVDFATVTNAMSDVNAFTAFIQKYDPAFISVSLNREGFPKVVEQDPRFVPVFFDHAEVLYANREREADLVAIYGLKAIDPFRFTKVQYKELTEEALAPMSAEAVRMYGDDPANYSAGFVLACICTARGQYDEAMSYAAGITRLHPELPYGYALKGDALLGKEQYREAVRCYEKAMRLGQTAKADAVYWNLHLAYAKLAQHRKAYRLLAKYINPFSPQAEYKEIYQLGIAAGSVGKTREAITFLEIAKMKTPLADTEYAQKIAKALALQRGATPGRTPEGSSSTRTRPSAE